MGLSKFFRRQKWDEERARELESHLDAETVENIARGMTRGEARLAAQRKLGNRTLLREEVYRMNSLRLLDSFLCDARFALRTLARSPQFTIVAVLTLALGIGANTAIFSVVDAVLLKPLPYPNPDQLVGVFQQMLQDGVKKTGASYLTLEDWRRLNHVFSEIAASQGHDLTLTGRGEPSVLHVSVITPEMLPLLDANPLAGHLFSSDDGKPGAPPVVILTEGVWRSRFGADPGIIGSSIDLDKRAFTVIGILPSDFRIPFAEQAELWLPLAQDPLFGPWMPRRGGHWLRVVARLKPGVSLARAQAEMDAVNANLARQFPAELAGWTVQIAPLQEQIVGNVKTALFVLWGTVSLVLLIACANVANLLLTRATSRAKEMAVRAALGAGRSQIVRQLLTESALLGLLGGIAGLLLAYWGVGALRAFLPPDLPQIHAIGLDRWVLAFGLALSLAASFLFGLAPALFASRSDLQAQFQTGAGRGSAGGGYHRARALLAAAQIALAMVLLVAAGLLARSFAALTTVNPGFDPRDVVKADISLPQFQYSTPQQWTAFSTELLARVQSSPGLHDSALAVPLPLIQGKVNLAFVIAGNPPLPPGAANAADYVSVSPDYFRVMAIPLLRGRVFTPQDSPSAPRVAVISAALARMYFPNGDPLGRRMSFAFPPDRGSPREIVGVVGDVRDTALSDDPGPMMYVPFAQAPFWGSAVIVKTTLPAANVAAAIRQEVAQIDKDLPVTGVESLSEAVAASVAEPRFRTWLLSLFGVIALLLAATGIFGVISYSASLRRREIGIRMALGALPGDILKMLLSHGLMIVGGGIAVGALASAAVSRLLGHLLFSVGPGDPVTYALVVAMLSGVALLACYFPARGATKIDPNVALRHE